MLDISGNKVGDDRAMFLTEALKEGATMTTLDMSDNEVRDEEAKFLAEALKEDSYPDQA